MKAYVVRQLGMPDSHRVIDWPSPTPQPGHVVIRVRASGVNFPDMLMVQGKYQHTPPAPFIPGHEVAGDIMAVGEGVTGYRPGDRVVAFMRHGGFGAFCTETLVKDDHFLAKLPDEVSYVAAASMPLAYGTAFHALRKGRVKSSDTVLILGASGGVGLATVQIAKLLGARVIACASSEDKLATCRAHGADECVNYETTDLRAEIRRLTADRGLDVAIDPVGDKYAEPVVRGMAWGGRYVIVGFAGGQIPRIPLNLVLLKGCELIGIGVGVNADKDCTEYVQNQDQMLQWVAHGQLQPVVSATYPLERAADALSDIIARKVKGKIVLTMQ